MIKYIVFDFDGTLADTFDVFKTIATTEYGEYDVDFKLFIRSRAFVKRVSL